MDGSTQLEKKPGLLLTCSQGQGLTAKTPSFLCHVAVVWCWNLKSENDHAFEHLLPNHAFVLFALPQDSNLESSQRACSSATTALNDVLCCRCALKRWLIQGGSVPLVSLSCLLRAGNIYNIVDDDPASRSLVVAYARRLLSGQDADFKAAQTADGISAISKQV